MSYVLDTRTIDEVCEHFIKFADTIERMIVSKHVALGENIPGLTETVVDAKQQLSELAGYAKLDDKQATMVLNLVNRYRNLEGTLKEVRNDQTGKRQGPPGAGRSLPSLGRDGDRRESDGRTSREKRRP